MYFEEYLRDTPTHVVFLVTGVLLVIGGLVSFGITTIIGIFLLIGVGKGMFRARVTHYDCDNCGYHREEVVGDKA